MDGAVSVLKKVPNAAFSLADLLKSHSAQQAHKEDGAVMAQLLQRLHSGESFADTVRSCPAASLLAPAHLLALLCDEDPAMRNAGAKEGALTSQTLSSTASKCHHMPYRAAKIESEGVSQGAVSTALRYFQQPE